MHPLCYYLVSWDEDTGGMLAWNLSTIAAEKAAEVAEVAGRCLYILRCHNHIFHFCFMCSASA